MFAPVRVLILEQCNGSWRGDYVPKPKWHRAFPLAPDSPAAAAASAHLYERIVLFPNRGREARAYLWYIVNHWDSLAPTTLFLQGDAIRHGLLGAVGLASLRNLACPGGLLDQLAAGCWAFLSLSGRFSAPFGGEPYRTKCEIYRDFGGDAGARKGRTHPCRLWEVTTAGGNFAAHRDAIRRHPLPSYRRWLNVFESPRLSDDAFWAHEGLGGRWWQADDRLFPSNWSAAFAARSAKDGASLFERAWAFIFGCARVLEGPACAFGLGSNASELEAACLAPLAPPARVRAAAGWAGCERITMQSHGSPVGHAVGTGTATPHFRSWDAVNAASSTAAHR